MTCDNWTKVGIARNVYARHQSIQVGNPYPVKVYYAIKLEPGQAEVAEPRAHYRLSHLAQRRGEWFLIEPETVFHIVKEEIERLGRPVHPRHDFGPPFISKRFTGYMVHVEGKRVL